MEGGDEGTRRDTTYTRQHPAQRFPNNPSIAQKHHKKHKKTIPVEGGDEGTRRDTTYTRQHPAQRFPNNPSLAKKKHEEVDEITQALRKEALASKHDETEDSFVDRNTEINAMSQDGDPLVLDQADD